MAIEVGGTCYDLHTGKIARVISRKSGKYGTWAALLEDPETGVRYHQSGMGIVPSEIGWCAGDDRMARGTIHRDEANKALVRLLFDMYDQRRSDRRWEVADFLTGVRYTTWEKHIDLHCHTALEVLAWAA